jgi:predicted RNA-binding protein with PUA-like domain
MHYWLVKTEASCYSIDDLKKEKKTLWTGIRNFQARNYMTQMQKGDHVLIYHSNGTPNAPSGVYGVARVSTEAVPDPTQFDHSDEHYEPRATHETPVWCAVELTYDTTFSHPITLAELKLDPATSTMEVCQRGSRLSVTPVASQHFSYIVQSLS